MNLQRERNLLIVVLSLLLISVKGNAQLYSVYWQKFSYNKTNFSSIKPFKIQNFSILTTTLKVGYRKNIKKIKSSKLLALDPIYLCLENTNDFYNYLYGHQNLYNNNNKQGLGLQIHYQQDTVIKHWIRYFQADFYSEFQIMNTFVKKVRNWFEEVENKDFSAGVRVWTNSDNNLFKFGLENYFDLSYHWSNFYKKGNTGFVILAYSPRLLYNIKYLELYINEDLVIDLLHKGYWNRNPYSNQLTSNIGMRKINPLRNLLFSKKNKGKIFCSLSFLIFVEYSQIKFIDNIEEWAFKVDLANYDFRAGCIIYWPLGATKWRPVGQIGLN